MQFINLLRARAVLAARAWRGLARLRLPTLAIFVMAGIAACSGQSCSCITPIKGGFPTSQIEQNGIQTRFTASFLSYVSTNAATILPKILPANGAFTIPQTTSSGATICAGTPAPTCQIGITPTSLTLTPSAPDTLSFAAGLIVKSLENIPISSSIGTCVASLDTTLAGGMSLSATGTITFPIDGTTHLTSIALANVAIARIDDGDLNLNEVGSDPQCAIADISFIKGLLIDVITSQLGGLVSGAVTDELCESCTDVSDCAAGATACTSSQCIGPDKKNCIQQLGIQGRANVGATLASFSPGLTSYVDIMEAAGGYAAADTGLSLGILGGAQADPHSTCVPAVAAPEPVSIIPSGTFGSDTIPGTSTPYHVGVGVHVSHLTDLAYAFWNSGGLCINAGTASVSELSAKTLSIIIPSIANLIHTDDAPMMFKLRPQQPPTFKLGKGTFTTDSKGNKSVDDPLITIQATQFLVDMYLFIDDRYVRIATIEMNLALPLSLETNATGGLLLVAGDLSKAFTNVVVTNTELLAETAAQLQSTLPSLLATAIGPLLSSVPALSLPTLAGLQLVPQTFTSTDPDTTNALQYLAIFANVMEPTAAQIGATTNARLLSVTTPPTEVFQIAHRDGRVPSVTVGVTGETGGKAFEWTYAFDGGTWHAFQSASTLTITDSALWLQGRHTVQIAGRIVGQPTSLSAPVTLPFFIDSEAPMGSFTVNNGQLVAQAQDVISPVDALVYRVGNGDFARATTLGPAPHDPSMLVVEARDEAGNIARLAYHPSLTANAATGCDMSGHGSPLSLFAIAVVVALLLRRRVAMLALLALAACHNDAGKGDMLNPADEIGRQHAIAMFQDKLMIAAYDQNFGDFGYAEVDTAALTTPTEWLIIDGVDETQPKVGSTPYRHGRTAPGPDTGYYSSMAVTSKGQPRFAYWDATNHQLKYAAGPFPFSSHAVDAGSADGTIEVGTFPAIVLNQNDAPIVAYAATGMGNTQSGFISELRVATAKTPDPQHGDDWDIVTVDTAAISCGGRCGTGLACIMTPTVNGVTNTNPVISTCEPVDIAPCSPACSSSDVCIDKKCVSPVAPRNDGDIPEGTGLFTKLVRSPQGENAIVYYDHSNHLLRSAIPNTAGTFLPQTIDGGAAGQDVGQQVGAAFGGDGTLHFAYVDAIAGSLLYKTLVPPGTITPVATIDDGTRTDGPHLVGASASVIVNGAVVTVLYQDQTLSELELATGPNTWTHAASDASTAGEGFSSHQIAGSGATYFSTYDITPTLMPTGKIKLGQLVDTTTATPQ